MVWRLAGIVALALLAACSNLTTEHPVGGSMAGQSDARFIGVWKIAGPLTENKPGQAGYMFVSPKKGSTDLHAVVVDWSATDPMSTVEFDVTTGTLGSNAFVNIHNVVENGKPAGKQDIDGYMPFAYRFEKNGRLVIYDHTDAGLDIIKKAVQSGHLRGRVINKGSHGKDKNNMVASDDIHLTADQKSLDAFFAANGSAIFTDLVDAFEPVKVP